MAALLKSLNAIAIDMKVDFVSLFFYFHLDNIFFWRQQILYIVNLALVERFEKEGGLYFTGRDSEGQRMEIAELDREKVCTLMVFYLHSLKY